jgi:hypothetical protein
VLASFKNYNGLILKQSLCSECMNWNESTEKLSTGGGRYAVYI